MGSISHYNRSNWTRQGALISSKAMDPPSISSGIMYIPLDYRIAPTKRRRDASEPGIYGIRPTIMLPAAITMRNNPISPHADAAVRTLLGITHPALSDGEVEDLQRTSSSSEATDSDIWHTINFADSVLALLILCHFIANY